MECYICCRSSNLFGISTCAHYVCLKCTIRTRVVGGLKACPVCRAVMGEVSVSYILCPTLLIQSHHPSGIHRASAEEPASAQFPITAQGCGGQGRGGCQARDQVLIRLCPQEVPRIDCEPMPGVHRGVRSSIQIFHPGYAVKGPCLGVSDRSSGVSQPCANTSRVPTR